MKMKGKAKNTKFFWEESLSEYGIIKKNPEDIQSFG